MQGEFKHLARCCLLVAFGLMVFSRPAAAESATGLSPLSTEAQKTLSAIRADPKPEQLTQNLHYVWSDERRHDYFQKQIQDLGCVFIGVGSNQNYAMAGWSKPELMIIVDFDQLIVDLHRVYRVAFLNADTPQAFLDLWSKSGRDKLTALVKKAYTKTNRRRAMYALKFSHRILAKRLRESVELYKNANTPFYLSDQAQYEYIVQLYRTNRIYAIRGDFTAKKTISDIATKLKDLKKTVRVFYISNCESYFEFKRQYRKNMLAIPTDDKSVILRTRAWRPWSRDGKTPVHYNYFTQSYQTFRAWLRAGIRKVGWIAPYTLFNVKSPHHVLTRLPKSSTKSKM
jgi:hypothetical protein